LRFDEGNAVNAFELLQEVRFRGEFFLFPRSEFVGLVGCLDGIDMAARIIKVFGKTDKKATGDGDK